MGANKKPIPTSSIHCAICSAVRSRFTPNASKTSALPDLLLTLRLPCLATGRPAPATTKAAVVEILNVPALSPPVPHVSIISTLSDGLQCCTPHRHRTTGDLFHSLALHPQRNQETGYLCMVWPHQSSPHPSHLQLDRWSDDSFSNNWAIASRIIVCLSFMANTCPAG